MGVGEDEIVKENDRRCETLEKILLHIVYDFKKK